MLLPTLAAVAFGVYFLIDKVPGLVQRQRQEAGFHYRDVAEKLRAQAAASPVVRCERRRGWTLNGWLGRREDGSRVPWGWVRDHDRVLVWVGAGREVAFETSEPYDSVDLGLVFYAGVPTALALLVLLSGYGVWQRWRYDRKRDEFLYATAHDLRTPVGAIQSMLTHEDVELERMCQRMNIMIDNIREFIRRDGHRAPPKAESFALAAAFQEAYALFADDFAEEKSGAVELSGELSLAVCADRTLTVQILWNLLGNDLKYSAAHGKIRAVIVPDGDRVLLSLADSGPGMSTEQRRHCFDRYYRAGSAVETGKGGFGIGLCNAREFARAMKGELSVRENRPRGCVFTLELPRG